MELSRHKIICFWQRKAQGKLAVDKEMHMVYGPVWGNSNLFIQSSNSSVSSRQSKRTLEHKGRICFSIEKLGCERNEERSMLLQWVIHLEVSHMNSAYGHPRTGCFLDENNLEISMPFDTSIWSYAGQSVKEVVFLIFCSSLQSIPVSNSAVFKSQGCCKW